MKPSVPRCLNRVGLLLRQIQAEQWPTRLGDWREVLARCEVLRETAPKEARVRHWKADSLRAFMYRSGLISYDQDSGLWYCPIFSPLQDYPEGWKSDALLEREKRKACKGLVGAKVALKKMTSRLRSKAVKRSFFLGCPDTL